MRHLEYRDTGESGSPHLSSTLLAWGLVILGLILLAVVLTSGTTGVADVSIPTRLFPAP